MGRRSGSATLPGAATWGDVTIIWARDVADGQVKGFIVENKTPGFTADKIQNKMALRVVQNALITLNNCRVPEENRLQKDLTFRDTARVLRMTRAFVAWEAVGSRSERTSMRSRMRKPANSSGSRSQSSNSSRICW